MSTPEAGRAKPAGDEMRGSQPGTEDLVGEIARLADDPQSDENEILAKLETLGETFTVDEIFAVIPNFDTPDLLG
jgi:hypothetical protein